MLLHRPRGQEEGFGDLLVGGVRGEEFGDLSLAGGEPASVAAPSDGFGSGQSEVPGEVVGAGEVGGGSERGEGGRGLRERLGGFGRVGLGAGPCAVFGGQGGLVGAADVLPEVLGGGEVAGGAGRGARLWKGPSEGGGPSTTGAPGSAESEAAEKASEKATEVAEQAAERVHEKNS
ncbi:hypothetical protein GCM10010441_26910 [Kitasatospora paracochleata]|uniref:Uncharacterized protein n=1 Tax=Kitasatospora paracochleata TaxID=58354 RepID=A0ABT1IW89_9ACTN|nr:hypothetical protein [Kitasatospora paracochleata]MCP2309411.1 hypothetical protein [Kitasatospora paracochleata]